MSTTTLLDDAIAWQGLTAIGVPATVRPMDADDRAVTMNVSLPRGLRDYVAERVATDGYTSASEFVRELIRKDRARRAGQERLEELLVEGIASGPAAEWTSEEWASLRERVARRVGAGEGSADLRSVDGGTADGNTADA